MAEPGDPRTLSMRIIRESSVSRVEVQLLAKVYDLLVPVVQEFCRPSPHSAERVRRRRPTNSPSHKGFQS
jgi:hypothetical protein